MTRLDNDSASASARPGSLAPSKLAAPLAGLFKAQQAAQAAAQAAAQQGEQEQEQLGEQRASPQGATSGPHQPLWRQPSRSPPAGAKQASLVDMLQRHAAPAPATADEGAVPAPAVAQGSRRQLVQQWQGTSLSQVRCSLP